MINELHDFFLWICRYQEAIPMGMTKYIFVECTLCVSDLLHTFWGQPYAAVEFRVYFICLGFLSSKPGKERVTSLLAYTFKSKHPYAWPASSADHAQDWVAVRHRLETKFGQDFLACWQSSRIPSTSHQYEVRPAKQMISTSIGQHHCILNMNAKPCYKEAIQTQNSCWIDGISFINMIH